jgi:putative endopeptidase
VVARASAVQIESAWMLTRNFAPLLVALATAGFAQTPSKRPDVLRMNMDTSVSPGVDFFSYANGGWIKHHPIPASESSWGIGGEVDLDLYGKLRAISEHSAAKTWKAGSDEQKIGDFWKTAMDRNKANRLGLTPIQPELSQIDSIADKDQLVMVALALHRKFVDALFSLDVSQDEKQSDVMAVHLSQGGLGLPERDFYFNKEAGVAKIRDEYVKYISAILTATGSAEADKTATDIMAFETALAKISRNLEDLRDPEKNYNKMATRDFTAKLTPSVKWETWLPALNLNPPKVIVGQPEFFTGLETLLAQTPLETLKAYLRFHFVDGVAPYLDEKMEALNFHFRHQVLSGQKEPRPRWKRTIDTENELIGMVLGRIYVKDNFPPSAKKRYSDLVEAFRKAYSERIDRLTWMSPATKRQAQIKLAGVVKKVGFPDHWKDYSKLKIGTDSYCRNVLSAGEWQFNDMVSKYGKPVDRTEWGMSPQTYNAYYNPSNNEIVLPAAAFLVPGFNDSELDDAVIYGYAGASTIGHEMTHGFDDEGRHSDAEGNLRDWWTAEDAKRFQQRSHVMVEQFNHYEPLPGLHINGAASLGENMADYGGLLIGFDAFKKTLQYKEGKKIAGLTPVQRFYLGYALSWLQEERPELLRRQLLSDVHAPAKYRVIGPISNIPDFFKAFGVKPGQPMRRPDNLLVHVW